MHLSVTARSWRALPACLLSGIGLAAAQLAVVQSVYPEYDIGSTAPPEVTRDVEALIGEFAARWTASDWTTIPELWDRGEPSPYFLSAHQPDWLIG